MPFAEPVGCPITSTLSPAIAETPSIVCASLSVMFEVVATRTDAFTVSPCAMASTYAFVAASCAAVGAASPVIFLPPSAASPETEGGGPDFDMAEAGAERAGGERADGRDGCLADVGGSDIDGIRICGDAVGRTDHIERVAGFQYAGACDDLSRAGELREGQKRYAERDGARGGEYPSGIRIQRTLGDEGEHARGYLRIRVRVGRARPRAGGNHINTVLRLVGLVFHKHAVADDERDAVCGRRCDSCQLLAAKCYITQEGGCRCGQDA